MPCQVAEPAVVPVEMIRAFELEPGSWDLETRDHSPMKETGRYYSSPKNQPLESAESVVIANSDRCYHDDSQSDREAGPASVC